MPTRRARALWLLTAAAAVDRPAVAVGRLAAVALYQTGADWTKDEDDCEDARIMDEDDEGEDETAREGETARESETARERGSGVRVVRRRGAPRLATRLLAASLMCRSPDAVGVDPAHFDLAAARRRPGKHWFASNAHAMVDHGYRLATAPAPALRPAGLRLLRATCARLARSEDPDAPGSTLMEQFQAQISSALRAAGGSVVAAEVRRRGRGISGGGDARASRGERPKRRETIGRRRRAAPPRGSGGAARE